MLLPFEILVVQKGGSIKQADKKVKEYNIVESL